MIEAFHRAIRTGNQNSYKFALGRAIIEEYEGDNKILLPNLVVRIAGYYYKNLQVFKLRETNNPDQEPTAAKILRRLIKMKYGPLPAPKRMSKQFRDIYAAKLLSPPPGWGHSIFTYVLPCWVGATKSARGYYNYPNIGANDFFDYSLDKKIIRLSSRFAETIGSHRSTLLGIVILEWAKFLEKFNQTPNLVSKLSTEKPLRRLSRFRNLFLDTPIMSSAVCHICGNRLLQKDFTLDHVVPFEYIFCDEIWNLVPAHRCCNSRKGARVGSEQMIRRLVERNCSLWDSEITIIKKWLCASGESAAALEHTLITMASSALKAGFSQVDDSEFNS